MMLFQRQLIRAINSGQCIAVVGSGPSIEIGLPTWRELSEKSLQLLEPGDLSHLRSELYSLITQGNYPKVFSVISQRVGLEKLVFFIGQELRLTEVNGNIYGFLANWPFSLYLTTNYDDALSVSLRNNKVPIVTKLNSQSDFITLRVGATNTIYKIHGDTTSPENIVLTTEQYEEFRSSPSRKYWREKIRAILHMMDVVIIGYSISDPDFQDQLENLKIVASPDHPIYLFASGIPQIQMEELFAKHNIRVIEYRTSNGNHKDLVRTLERYSPFIAKRNGPNIGVDKLNYEDLELATSIYLFSELRLADADNSALSNAYSVATLRILSEQSSSLSLRALHQKLADRVGAATHPDPIRFKSSLDNLYQQGFIQVINDSHYEITPRGREKLAIAQEEKRLLEEKFRASCEIFLISNFSELSADEVGRIVGAMGNGLANAFMKRGIEIARSVFLDVPVDLSDALDLLDVINQGCAEFGSDSKVTAAFADLMIEVILQPDENMRNFLAALSQGYFAFHALGLDIISNKHRLEAAQSAMWVLDSSILIPMIARDCLNYEYALDLSARASAIGLRLVTTRRLFAEVVGHLRWAQMNFSDQDTDSPRLILAALGEGGYSPNLFIEGFIKWSQNAAIPTLSDYFDDCLKQDKSGNLEDRVLARLAEIGIQVLEFDEFPDFKNEYYAERDEIVQKIVTTRGETVRKSV